MTKHFLRAKIISRGVNEVVVLTGGRKMGLYCSCENKAEF